MEKQYYSSTSCGLRKTLRQRRKEKALGITHFQTTTYHKTWTPKSLQQTPPKKSTIRRMTPLITCWSSSDDSADWEEMKARIRERNASQQQNLLNAEWDSSSSEEESVSAKIERRKLELSARKGASRAYDSNRVLCNLERTFSNLGLSNDTDQKQSNQQIKTKCLDLGKENIPQDSNALDEYERQVYCSLKLGLRGGAYDSNRTLCELIRQKRDDPQFGSSSENLLCVWGIGPHRAERFGKDMLRILNTNDNIRLLRKSREKETLQSKAEAADSHPKIPEYVIF